MLITTSEIFSPLLWTIAYDESGNAKDVTFETSKVLTDGAYLCLKVAPIRGVVTWAEMQFDELPSSVQEKYKE